MLFPEANVAGAEAALRNLLKQLAEAMQAADRPVTFRMGAAVFNCCPQSVDEVIWSADALMYRGKKAGNNNVAVSKVLVTAPAR